MHTKLTFTLPKIFAYRNYSYVGMSKSDTISEFPTNQNKQENQDGFSSKCCTIMLWSDSSHKVSGGGGLVTTDFLFSWHVLKDLSKVKCPYENFVVL